MWLTVWLTERIERRLLERHMAMFHKAVKDAQLRWEENGWSAPNHLLSGALWSLKWTQDDLAERLGCHVSLVRDWLSNRAEAPTDIMAWLKRLKNLADNAPMSQCTVDLNVVGMMETAIMYAQSHYVGTSFESFDIPPPSYIRNKAEERFGLLLREAHVHDLGDIRQRMAFDIACRNLTARRAS